MPPSSTASRAAKSTKTMGAMDTTPEARLFRVGRGL
jgi:hypothetical protein